MLSAELIELVAQNCDSIQDRAQLASVNRAWHAACVRSLFHTVAIHSPRQSAAFFRHMDEFCERGWLLYVQRLDLSSFTARGSGWTDAQANALLSPRVVGKLLAGCGGRLRELCVGEQVMPAFVDPDVLRTAFFRCPRLQVLDFAGCCDAKFAGAMAGAFQQDAAAAAAAAVDRLQCVSFFMCMSLQQASFFIPFFKQATSRLSRIDLAHTRITSELLAHIDPAPLTHLSLQGCHGITCCSHHHTVGLLPFLLRATALVELNLGMGSNGMSTAQCCAACLAAILQAAGTHMPLLRTLHLGGHLHLDDAVLSHFHPSALARLERLSLASSPSITLHGLLQHVVDRAPNLAYLSVAGTPLALDFTKYTVLLLERCNAVNVLEIGCGTRSPLQWHGGWSLVSHGRRSYYTRHAADPRFACANKLLMDDRMPDAPMLKYWCYSY